MILQSNPTLLREGESGGKGVTVIYCDGTEGHVDRWNIKKKKKMVEGHTQLTKDGSSYKYAPTLLLARIYG